MMPADTGAAIETPGPAIAGAATTALGMDITGLIGTAIADGIPPLAYMTAIGVVTDTTRDRTICATATASDGTRGVPRQLRPS